MAAARIALATLNKNHYNVGAWMRLLKPKPSFFYGPASYRLTACTQIRNKQLRNSMELITHGDQNLLLKNTVIKRPLLVFLAWLAAKRRHCMKLINFYMEQGFDCVLIIMQPRQLMWPVKGSQPLAKDVLEFLEKNTNYEQIVIHGFSVGGYLYGEMLNHISNDHNRYAHVVNRIVGQIWDSTVDVSELAIGTPRAVFPNNMLLQNMLKKYLEYHMKAFYKQSTQYYIRSSQQFHSTFIRAPALFFMSKADPVGTITSNLRARDSWAALGTETYIKIFEQSPHVGHFRKYPKEYITELFLFLDKLGLIRDEEIIRARLQS